MSDPPDFILMFVPVIGAVAWFTWWLRGHIGKEHLATKEALVELARSQRDDLNDKLTEARAKLAELPAQIATSAPPSHMLATVVTAEKLFEGAQLISDKIGYTLTANTVGGDLSQTPFPLRAEKQKPE